jgi:hypothetical protein
VALKRDAELSEIQRSIRRYSVISNLTFSAAAVVPVFAYVGIQGMGAAERLLVALVLAGIGVWAFRRVDAWCHEQVLCPNCSQSLFTRFLLEVQVGFWRWVGGIPEKCRHCDAPLSAES